MQHLYYSKEENATYPVTLLVSTIRKDEIQRAYLDPYGVDLEDVLVLDLHYSQSKKKTPMGEMRKYITEELVPILKDAETKIVVCTDAEYFKALTKAAKVEVNLGYAMDCEYGDFKVVYAPSYRQMFYDPDKVKSKIKQGMKTVIDLLYGTYTDPGHGIIHFAEYPQTPQDIEAWLVKLLNMNCPLTFDIEGFSLKHHKAGIGTITMCWNKHEGIAFPVDYVAEEWEETKGTTTIQHYGRQGYNTEVRAMLKQFFKLYTQKAIYHNIAFDAYVLIYQLFMTDILDTEGLLEGLGVLLSNWDCTKLISYLATNSCAGNKLSLKEQAQEFAGNYAEDDIKDITKIPLDRLLQYNLVDGLSTWFVHDKHYGTMVNDQQEDIYKTLFKEATVDIVQMQLTGMPIDMRRTKHVKRLLKRDEDKALKQIRANDLVKRYEYRMNEDWVVAKNLTLKKKVVTLADAKEVFNPNSPDQLVELLYNRIGLPIISRTKTKQPSADGDTLKALRFHTSDPMVKDLLEGLIDFKAVNIILNTFIAAMEQAALGPDGWHYLFGNFNLGGTVSGRLSSSKPNLQNLPAKSLYAKLIKSCFVAPPGWLFLGLDFASLEDRISALTTKDPNKLKVYTDGYDGHCLRAFAYYPDVMPDIVDTVASINTIKKKYPDQRDESKTPTFLLTYGGTYIGMMKQLGWTKEKSQLVESRYHDLYVASDQWIAAKLQEASQVGYVTVAFGLRVRTPLLHQVLLGNSRTPYEAQAEGRTAGNALGQSWCLLNSRAGSEFMKKVRDSEYRLSIRPCAQIHDAGYFLVKDDIGAVMFTNKHLVEAVNWQDDDAIRHPDVGLGGEVSVFWPSWAEEAEIPNGATEQQIRDVIEKHVLSLNPA